LLCVSGFWVVLVGRMMQPVYRSIEARSQSE
jgi:hypothetical protein